MSDHDFAPERAVVQTGLAVGFANCFEEAYQRCIAGGDRRVEVAKMFKALGLFWAGIVGTGDDAGTRLLLGDWNAKIKECLAECADPPADDGTIFCPPELWVGIATRVWTVSNAVTFNDAVANWKVTGTAEVVWRLLSDPADKCLMNFFGGTCRWQVVAGNLDWSAEWIDFDFHGTVICSGSESGSKDLNDPDDIIVQNSILHAGVGAPRQIEYSGVGGTTATTNGGGCGLGVGAYFAVPQGRKSLISNGGQLMSGRYKTTRAVGLGNSGIETMTWTWRFQAVYCSIEPHPACP